MENQSYFLTKLSIFGNVRSTMVGEKGGKPPDRGAILSDEEKARISKESSKVHRECEPLFSLVKKITEPGIQGVILDIIRSINQKVLDIHKARKAKQSGVGKKMEAEHLISDLKRKVDEFCAGEIDIKDKEILQQIVRHTETTLVSHIRQVRTKDS